MIPIDWPDKGSIVTLRDFNAGHEPAIAVIAVEENLPIRIGNDQVIFPIADVITGRGNGAVTALGFERDVVHRLGAYDQRLPIS